jgi:DNA-binding helix-hairpin-helix protein with protein kinase domain
MADLPQGYAIKTAGGKQISVGQKLGEGGQGAVYKVNYDGKPKALKWYSGKKFGDPEKFYANLQNNIDKGSPTKAFLWPEDITEHHGAAFGYIMDLRPQEYKDFSRFIMGRESFASITAMVNTALHITAGFRELHLKGYSYQDLNDGNFFINPKNGDVLICDNDNVSAFGKNSGIAGKARYMAPEIVRGEKSPDSKTDSFSLAVILFLLWTSNHPLEGKAAFPVCMDAKSEKRIYGENPVFIFDPDDKSNMPVQSLNKGAITRWPLMPAYLQDIFMKSFSKEALMEPSKRPLNREWLRTFIRMRTEIFKCSCNNIYFADPVNLNPCTSCNKSNAFSMYIKAGRYNIPVHQRTKLYACHTEKDSEDFETLTGEALLAGSLTGGTSGFKLKNLSANNWNVNGSNVAQGGDFTLEKGMKINFGGRTGADAEII